VKSSSLTRFSIRLLIVLSSIALLTISCAGGTVRSTSVIPTTEVTQPAAPREPTTAEIPTLVVVGRVTPTPSAGNRQSTATPTDEGVVEIEVGDYFFQPQVMTVTVGTLVRWRPVGDLFHTIVSKESPSLFKGGTEGLGSRPFTFTFRNPGTYAYFCDYHPDAMDAWIVVVEGN
jgi:plastocyanin